MSDGWGLKFKETRIGRNTEESSWKSECFRDDEVGIWVLFFNIHECLPALCRALLYII
jgi:hypothetical protein